MKGKVKLLPTIGKVSVGSIVETPNGVNQVKEREGSVLTFTDDTTEVVKVCKLLKYFVVGNKSAELDYDDYDKVVVGDVVDVTTKSVLAPAYVGDQVLLFKLDKDTIKLADKPIEGYVVGVENGQYKLELNDDTVVTVKRHYFKLLNRLNYKYVGTLNGIKEQVC